MSKKKPGTQKRMAYAGGKKRCKICKYRIRGKLADHNDGDHHRRAGKWKTSI